MFRCNYLRNEKYFLIFFAFSRLRFNFELMMICAWTPWTSQDRPENDHKRQCMWQIRPEKMKVVRPVYQLC